jgi:hypothetical protein
MTFYYLVRCGFSALTDDFCRVDSVHTDRRCVIGEIGGALRLAL